MSGSAIFSPRLLIAWIAAAALTFAATLYFMGGGGGDESSGGRPTGTSTFSRSAVGYAGIAELLQQLGMNVVRSRYNSRAKVAEDGVLVVAEPLATFQTGVATGELLEAKRVLLILPKWQGRPSRTHPGWIATADLVPEVLSRATLGLALPRAELVRRERVDAWSVNALGPLPAIAAPVQLVRDRGLTPLVGTVDGMLLGERREHGRRLWVLSDPDVIANHGLVRGDNAAFAVALITALRGAKGDVVFEETVHGYVTRPTHPMKLLFQFPFVFAAAQGALAVALLLWATVARFGAPQAPPPPLAAGKLGLIQNAAKLLDFAGHHPAMVQRYVQATLREVAQQLHAPRGLSDAALIEWLRRVGEARGVTADCGEIYRDAVEQAGLRRGGLAKIDAVARAIHQWKGEIIDGASGHPRRHGRAAGRGAQGRRRAG